MRRNSLLSLNDKKRTSRGSIKNGPNSNIKQTPADCSSKILNGLVVVDSYGSIEKQKDVAAEPKHVSVSDIIGSFGWFQFAVLLFSGFREAAVGYDAVVMSIILQPESYFVCSDRPKESLDTSKPFNETAQCFLLNNFEHESSPSLLIGKLNQTTTGERCESWLFPHLNDQVSLIADWSLVCHRHWLVAFIESAYFFGLVSGNLLWGFYADKVGRRKAYLVAHSVALIAGWATVVMPSVELFALCRFFSALGAVGYNIIYSIQIELIGTKHRAFSTTLNHFGWGLGVICVPLADHLFSDYRYIVVVAPFITLIMFPLAFWLPESSRWLMANEEFSKAKNELIRAARFNGKQINHSLEKNIHLLKEKTCLDKAKQEALSDKQSYKLLLTKPRLVKDTLILAYISFFCHLFYYLLTISFGYMKNLPVEANFIISGAGDWVSVAAGAVLLKYCRRRTCIKLYLVLLSSSFALQSLIDSDLVPSLDTPLINTINNGIGTLSALLLVFVILIVNQEIYPTVIRQTGSSITNTLGESGSTLAPTLIQMGRLIGQWKVDAVYSIVCIFGIVAIQFLTETDDIDLSDN